MKNFSFHAAIFLSLLLLLAACKPRVPADTLNPVIAITAPADGSEFTEGEAITVSGTAGDDRAVEGVSVQLNDDESVAAALNDDDGTWTVTLNAPAGAGSHDISATVTDEAGNSAAASISFLTVLVPDAVDPEVAITAPADGAEFTEGDTITVAGTASDARGIAAVTVRLNDGEPADASYDEADGTWTAAVIAPAGAGDHTLTATAADAAGNTESASISFTTVLVPDTVYPEVEITAPADGSEFTEGETITVTGTASDDRGVAGVSVQVNDDDSVEAVFAGTDGTWTVTLPAPSPDTHTFSATATDGAGNSTTASISITTVPLVPPLVEIVEPTGGMSFRALETVVIAGSASHDDGIATVEVLAQGSSVGTADYNPATGEWTFDWTAPLAVGDYELEARATAVGALPNSTLSSSVSVTIFDDTVGEAAGGLERVPPLGSGNPAGADMSVAGLAADLLDSGRHRGDSAVIQNVRMPELNRIIVSFNPTTRLVLPASATAVELNEWQARIDNLVTDFSSLGVESGRGLLPTFGVAVLEARATDDIDAVIASLNSDRRVRHAERDYWVRADALPNDPGLASQWAHELTDAQVAWSTVSEAPNVRVAVLDSGIAAPVGTTDLLDAHPDLVGNLIPGFDFVSGLDLTPDPTDPADPVFDALVSRYPQLQFLDGDDNPGWDGHPYEEISTDYDPQDGLFTGLSTFGGHGTHVAGIVGATGNNASGIAGVAWNVQIQPIRVLGHFGSGTGADVLAGVGYAAGFPVTDPDDAAVTYTNPTPVNVINMSLGGGPYSSIAEDLYADVRAAGVLVVASAGNDGTDDIHYPSGYDGVLSVSSTDYIHWVEERGGPATAFSDFFSTYGATVDISAPGGLAWRTAADLDTWNLATGLMPQSFVLSSGWEWFDAADPVTANRTDDPVYFYSAGTSMSAPYVSGAAALLLGLDGTLDADTLEEILTGTATRVDDGFLSFSYGDPEADWDQYFGYGAINLPAAIAAVESGLIERLPQVTYVEAVNSADSSDVHRVEADEDLTFEITGLPAGYWLVRAGVDADGDGEFGGSGEYYGEFDSTIAVNADEPIHGDVSFILERQP